MIPLIWYLADGSAIEAEDRNTRANWIINWLFDREIRAEWRSFVQYKIDGGRP